MLASEKDDFRLPETVNVPTRFLTPRSLLEMFYFAPDMARREVEPNYLNNQKLVAYFEHDWANVMR